MPTAATRFISADDASGTCRRRACRSGRGSAPTRGVAVLDDVGDRAHPGDEQQAGDEDHRGVAEGEPEAGAHRRACPRRRACGWCCRSRRCGRRRRRAGRRACRRSGRPRRRGRRCCPAGSRAGRPRTPGRPSPATCSSDDEGGHPAERAPLPRVKPRAGRGRCERRGGGHRGTLLHGRSHLHRVSQQAAASRCPRASRRTRIRAAQHGRNTRAPTRGRSSPPRNTSAPQSETRVGTVAPRPRAPGDVAPTCRPGAGGRPLRGPRHTDTSGGCRGHRRHRLGPRPAPRWCC